MKRKASHPPSVDEQKIGGGGGGARSAEDNGRRGGGKKPLSAAKRGSATAAIRNHARRIEGLDYPVGKVHFDAEYLYVPFDYTEKFVWPGEPSFGESRYSGTVNVNQIASMHIVADDGLYIVTTTGREICAFSLDDLAKEPRREKNEFLTELLELTISAINSHKIVLRQRGHAVAHCTDVHIKYPLAENP